MSFNAFSMSSEEYPGIFNRLICRVCRAGDLFLIFISHITPSPDFAREDSDEPAQPKAKIHSETSPFFQVTGKILGASTYSIPIFPDSTEPSSFTSVSYKYGMYATVPVYALYGISSHSHSSNRRVYFYIL